jgi:hypothetical protein
MQGKLAIEHTGGDACDSYDNPFGANAAGEGKGKFFDAAKSRLRDSLFEFLKSLFLPSG